MELKQAPDLSIFFETYIAETDAGSDAAAIQAFLHTATAERSTRVILQLKRLIDSSEIQLEEIGTTANRWFGDSTEAHAWLVDLLHAFEQNAEGSAATKTPKDSNGTPLSEGDAVTVIKDLKVKGGSSDLKRGTLIKKIHLIDDAENVECRIDGSTLVLKTIFLKKA